LTELHRTWSFYWGFLCLNNHLTLYRKGNINRFSSDLSNFSFIENRNSDFWIRKFPFLTIFSVRNKSQIVPAFAPIFDYFLNLTESFAKQAQNSFVKELWPDLGGRKKFVIFPLLVPKNYWVSLSYKKVCPFFRECRVEKEFL